MILANESMSHLQHVGIIMDGNGRWASLRRRPRAYGHIKGARAAKKIVKAATKLGLKYFTLYAFSTENWFRPPQEVRFLMRILERYLKKETANLVKENIQFSVIGDIDRLPGNLQKAIQWAIHVTTHCTGLRLIFALSYGSRSEILGAVKELAKKVQSGMVEPSSIDEKMFSQHLSTYPAPDLDLLIRTSGEQRLSNFLLWQSAYAELFFTKTLWPDFGEREFCEIVSEFSGRQRRFGRLAETNEQSAY